MTSPVTITLPGEPKGKGRGRVGKLHNGRPVVFTPSATKSYETTLRIAASNEMRSRAPFTGAVEVVVRAQFLVPASWSKKKREAALRGETMPTKRPDIDNVAKAVFDALNKVVWHDDALVVRADIQKRYGPQALLVITAREITSP